MRRNTALVQGEPDVQESYIQVCECMGIVSVFPGITVEGFVPGVACPSGIAVFLNHINRTATFDAKDIFGSVDSVCQTSVQQIRGKAEAKFVPWKKAPPRSVVSNPYAAPVNPYATVPPQSPSASRSSSSSSASVSSLSSISTRTPPPRHEKQKRRRERSPREEVKTERRAPPVKFFTDPKAPKRIEEPRRREERREDEPMYHPCNRQYKKGCNYGTSCKWVKYPFRACLDFLKGQCPYKEGQCPNLHVPLQEKHKPTTHPCLKRYGKCLQGSRCEFAEYPYDACLDHLKGRCPKGPVCDQLHIDKVTKTVVPNSTHDLFDEHGF